MIICVTNRLCKLYGIFCSKASNVTKNELVTLQQVGPNLFQSITLEIVKFDKGPICTTVGS